MVDSKGREFSYGQAWSIVKKIAAGLMNRQGIVARNTIMVECNQNAEFLFINFACELIGAIFIPVEAEASVERKSLICKETKSVLWLYNCEPLEFITSIEQKSTLLWNEENMPVMFPDRHVITQILYTTGTTGKSKGIALTNMANMALAENIKYGVNMKEDNVELIPLPISHSHGLRCCYANLLNGSTIVLTDGLLRIKDIFRMFDQYSISAMDLSPGAVELLLKLSKGKFWEYGRRLDYIQIGTASLSEELKEKLINELDGVRLYNFYGSTESGRSCVFEFSKNLGMKNCIGRATKNAEIMFADEEGNAMQATREKPGLLASKGPMNMQCYWGNPELTKQVLREGYVFTNDLGYIDSNGYIFVLGRNDDVINCNGIKIAPEEIEDVAKEYEGVLDAACVPRKDVIAGQVPKLFIQVVKQEQFLLGEFAKYLGNRLDGNKVPKEIVFAEKIPRTFNGKIQRNKLM